ncbi:threonine aldolase family protein [Gallaecimonas mangrovi]|uniref:threonine aldolase family protein n=1 Tax=Gallaecimonas mangrovi TaxID=2291597 RepID=UPI000E208414|nr:beta-eliminating lyase-related protein [Gallaecimonas mangrovi]
MKDLLAAYKTAFNRCRYRLAGNQKLSLKDTFQYLSDATSADESFDVYGSGELINGFEEQVAQLLGKEAALFLPSGTMAQCMAMKIWCQEQGNNHIGLHPTSHLVLHEQNAYQALYGLSSALIGDADQVPTLAEMAAAHSQQPLAALILELPMREIGGQLPDWQALVAQSQWAREQNVRLHLDGARLWQCPGAYGKSLAEISALFDSVYVSFYKDLGGIAGAVLAADKGFIDEAKVWLRRSGGNLYSLAPYVVAAREGLAEHLPQMPKRLDNAKWLAEKLNQLPGVTTWPATPQTNMFRLHISTEPATFFEKASAWMQQHSLAPITPPYRTEANGLWCELTIGEAFDALPKEDWQHALAEFSKAVLAN